MPTSWTWIPREWPRPWGNSARGDAALDQRRRIALADRQLDQQLSEEDVGAIVERLVGQADRDLAAQPLLQAIDAGDQAAEQHRAVGGAASPGAGDVGAVAEIARAGVNQERVDGQRPGQAVAGDPLGVVDVVEDGGVAAAGDDALVRRVGLALPRGREERQVAGQLAGVEAREQILDVLVAADRAGGGLGQALDLVRRLARAQGVERGDHLGRISQRSEPVGDVVADDRDAPTRQLADDRGEVGDLDLGDVLEPVIRFGGRRRVPVVVGDHPDEPRRGGAGDHQEGVGRRQRHPVGEVRRDHGRPVLIVEPALGGAAAAGQDDRVEPVVDEHLAVAGGEGREVVAVQHGQGGGVHRARTVPLG
jgi:hypothetical protein